VAKSFWIQVYRKKLLYLNDYRLSCSAKSVSLLAEYALERLTWTQK